MSVATGSPGRKSFTQLGQRTVGQIQQFRSVQLCSPPKGNHGFLASPALCLSFGFRNLINTVGLSSTTGRRGKPLRAVPNFTGRKETSTDDFCYHTCKIVSGGLAVRKNHKTLQPQFSLHS